MIFEKVFDPPENHGQKDVNLTQPYEFKQWDWVIHKTYLKLPGIILNCYAALIAIQLWNL